MGFSDLFDAIAPFLPQGTKVAVGAESIYSEDAPPRLVWVPSDSDFDTADGHATSSQQFKVRHPRAIKVETISFDIHCWGRGNGTPASDMDAVQQLYQSVIRAFHASMPGSYSLRGGNWAQGDGSELTSYGRCFILRATISVPVLDDPFGIITRTITALPQTTEMQFPDGHVVSGTPAP